MMTEKQNLQALFSTVTNYFSPKIIGEVNDVYIKIVKMKGYDVPWHTHDREDELFYIIKGRLTMAFRRGMQVSLKKGEFYIVKQGTEHRVYSEQECWIMLIENKTTKHTGNVQSSITKSINEQRY
jgi:mannose-6-phosphate isomerase-like protein (cupin superfamily)